MLWDQRLDSFGFREGKVIVDDLGQIQILEDLGQWEYNVSSGGIGFLIEHFRYARVGVEHSRRFLFHSSPRGRESLSRHGRSRNSTTRDLPAIDISLSLLTFDSLWSMLI